MEYEQALALVRAQLREAEFQAEQAAGRARSLEQAVEDALHLRLPLPSASHGGMGTAQALTVREREVVILIAQGKSNAEIADALVLSKRTVEKHIANILSELGLTSRSQVVRWAIAHGLLDVAS
jgi:DNA-binding NarL/FixJ family response regulator